MESPTTTELRIIRSLIDENFGSGSQFLKQIPELRCANRTGTGKGYFIQFDDIPEDLRVDNVHKVISIDLKTNLPAPRDVVGFTLFIDDGAMTCFEGYTFGSFDWPGELPEKWLIMNARS